MMGCVNPDGTITSSARRMLQILTEPMTPEEAARAAGQPLFKVRSSLREMVESGLIENEGDRYLITESGLQKLSG
ncbi:MAG: hypothetical protein AB1746_13935 [Candidatus Zixiibacteriota bacterium]